ncbi:MAG TPA: caspase family protein [Thermotogota bacterium]|nr:caspase family protein [Thermotogota bacterium]
MRTLFIFLGSLLVLSVAFATESLGTKIVIVGEGSQQQEVLMEDFLRGIVVSPDTPSPLEIDISISPQGNPAIFYSGEYNPKVTFSTNQDADVVLFHINAKGKMTMLWPDIVEDPNLNTRVKAGESVSIPRIFRFSGDYHGREFFQIFAFPSMDEKLQAQIETLAKNSEVELVYTLTNPLLGHLHPLKDFKRETPGGWASNMVDFYYNQGPAQTFRVSLEVPACPYWFLDGHRMDSAKETLVLESGPHFVQYYQDGTLFREIISVKKNQQQIQVQPAPSSGTLTPLPIEPQRKIFAFLVGINEYPSVAGQNLSLSTPVQDVQTMANLLKTSADSENALLQTKVLLNQQATKQAMQSFLSSGILGQVDQKTDVLFFFSGHGTTASDNNGDEEDGLDEMLVPYDVSFQEDFLGNVTLDTASCLRDDDLEGYFREIAQNSSNLLVIFDSCYSGGSSKGIKGISLGGTVKTIADFNRDSMEGELEEIQDNFLFLASSRGNQTSWVDEGLGLSVFTYFFARGLEGSADEDSDGWIDTTEIFRFLEREIPQNGYKQNPVLLNTSERNWRWKY